VPPGFDLGGKPPPLPGAEGQDRPVWVPGIPDYAQRGGGAVPGGGGGDLDALAAVSAAVAAGAPRGTAQVHLPRLDFLVRVSSLAFGPPAARSGRGIRPGRAPGRAGSRSSGYTG
jgi:hypothetical protein